MSTLPPPSAYPPGYLDESCGGTLIGISILFIVLEAIFVLLRYYARHLTGTPRGWDDLIIPAAWFANLGLSFVTVAGVGRHLAEVVTYHPDQLVSWEKSLYALEWLYLSSIALPKISIVALYLRIFTSRTARITCYILIFVIVANWISFIFASTFQCSPIAFQWDKTIAGGTCFNIEAAFKASGAPNIATDAVILVLPIPTVWRLKASWVRKAGLMIVFLTGSIGTIASCMRMRSMFLTEAFIDNTWASVTLVGWSIAEAGLYLIAACLVALRPIFSQLSPAWLRARLYNSSSKRTPQDKRGSSQGFSLGGLPLGASRAGFTEIKSAGNEDSAGRGVSSMEKALPDVPPEKWADVEQGLGGGVPLKGIRVESRYVVTSSERQ
ncbi:hypothetical protein MMC11_007057 [Xylographa trunciseda]|nr:hypothetical protein [Xylographa trunciseda]